MQANLRIITASNCLQVIFCFILSSHVLHLFATLAEILQAILFEIDCCMQNKLLIPVK